MNRFRRYTNRFLNRIELVFIALIGVTIVVVAAVQIVWLNPGKRCEAAGNWWDPATRICGEVVYLPNITHRPLGSKAPLYPGLPKSREEAAQAASAPERAPPPSRRP